MIRWIFILLLLFFATNSPAFSNESQAIGKWIVVDATCAECEKAGVEEIGKVILISESGIVDPLSGNCPDLTSFDEIIQRSIESLKDNRMIKASWIKNIPRKGIIYSGFINCRGMNFIKISLLDSKHMLYFFEDSSALLLQKID